jgi:hypothetical protein
MFWALSSFNATLTIHASGLGMEIETVTLKLPRELLSGAQRVATARDVTIGHMVRQLLKREVTRQWSERSSDVTNERLLAALEVLLARDMAEAQDWDDLAQRLRPHGYELRGVSDGIVLFKTSCGTRVCKGTDLGVSYATMVKRLGTDALGNGCEAVQSGIMPAGQIDPTRHAMLSGHIKAARSWPDLINRLACKGMELRLLGAGLGIHIASTGRHLCNSEAVGAGYDALVKRYGCKLPSDLKSVPDTLKNQTENQKMAQIARK